jgi:hypothetical protein
MPRQPTFFQGKSLHLTYKHHIAHNDLLQLVRDCGGDLKWYSVVHETGHDDTDYPHTHVAFEWTNRKKINDCRVLDFTFNGEIVHPNFQKITDCLHATRIFDEYHQKQLGTEGYSRTKSAIGPQNSIGTKRKVQEATSLWEACELLGVEPKTVADVRMLMLDRDAPRPVQHNYTNTQWTLEALPCFHSIFIYGATNTGKTQWAIHQFENPLVVSHIDQLKLLHNYHDGIIFDDMTFGHWPQEAVIHLTDWDIDRGINVKHGYVTIPAHLPKIFTSNKTYNEVFGADEHGAIRRRITQIIHVSGPTYNIFAPQTEPINLPALNFLNLPDSSTITTESSNPNPNLWEDELYSWDKIAELIEKDRLAHEKENIPPNNDQSNPSV